MSSIKWRALAYLTAALLLTGCGGGSSSPPSSQPAGSNNQGNNPTNSTGQVNVVSTGTITGFGSVFVHGVEYETTGAMIDTDEDSNVGESRLHVGMVVALEGVMHADGRTGEATHIHYGDYMVGPVEAIDAASYSFTVIGHIVYLDDLTVIDGVSFDTLKAGDIVEVSGFIDDNQAMDATRVALTLDAATFRMFGAISALDTVTMTFALGGMQVDYHAAGSLPATTLGNGIAVTVTGDITGGTLFADRVQLREPVQPTAGDHLVMDGIVSGVGQSGFTLGEQDCVVDDATRFERGMSMQDVALNVRLHVEGQYDAVGHLVVDSISMYQQMDVWVMGQVSSIDRDTGYFTVAGMTFGTEAGTMYVDSDMHMHQFRFGDILAGDILVVQGIRLGDGTFMAMSIDRQPGDTISSVMLAGGVTSVDVQAQTLSLPGKDVLVDNATRILSSTGTSVFIADFFSSIKVGDMIQVVGRENGDSITATDIIIGWHHRMMGHM